MKVCPVCQAKAFDDADICYGCLYRFKDNQSSSDEAVASSAPATHDAYNNTTHAGEEMIQKQHTDTQHVTSSFQSVRAPEFCIRFAPIPHEDGELIWRCKVELSE